METARQISFRKYGEHMRECAQCRRVPRSEYSMCELGAAILKEYQDAMYESMGIKRPIKLPPRLSWDDLARFLMVLEDKIIRTEEEDAMIAAIDAIIKERLQ